MKQITYKCDKCGRTIEPEKHYTISIKRVDPEDRETTLPEEPYPDINEENDYCHICMQDIANFIRIKTKVISHKEEIESEEKKKGNSKVDVKRILELTAEGMKGREIAKLLNCSEPAVSTAKRIYTIVNGKVRRKSECQD